eukprot:TRINITY_DN33063_c0_g1_i1.p1 TRINITY_DN33063_c0_g1~~TRINITY_DN33063_c0_g1_i1.p1  ORF type:complete len:809 (-),score=147.38 TRINITY_DN33063_c0_g1_i1:26-2452(-)
MRDMRGSQQRQQRELSQDKCVGSKGDDTFGAPHLGFGSAGFGCRFPTATTPKFVPSTSPTDCTPCLGRSHGSSASPPSSPCLGSRGDGSKRGLLARVGTSKAAWESVPFLVNWINHICGGCLGWTPVTISSIFDDLRTGLVLCQIVERLLPAADCSKGVARRPKTRTSCIANIDRALAFVWKQGVRSAQMCSADEIYDRDIRRTVSCLVEVFSVLQMRLREVRLKARAMVAWMQDVLALAGKPLSDQTLVDPYGYKQELRDDFADGTKVMSLLVSTGVTPLGASSRLRILCSSEKHFHQNGALVNDALTAAGCPVLLSPSEWSAPPNPFPDTLVYQLFVLWQWLQKARMPVGPALAVTSITKEKAMASFLDFLNRHFPSVVDACNACISPLSVRVSRTRFLSMMRSLEYLGDANFIWDCLDSASAGWITCKEFQELEQAVLKARCCDRASRLYERPREEKETAQCAERCRSPVEGTFSDPGSPPIATSNLVPLEEGESSVESFGSCCEEDAKITIGLLVEGSDGSMRSWPGRLEVLVAAAGGGQVRLPGYAEERARVYDEDERRHLELYERGRVVSARCATNAATVAAKAASTADLRLIDVDERYDGQSVHKGGGGVCEPEPTTSIDAWVVMADSSEQRMWLQTSVVDRFEEDCLSVGIHDPTDPMLVLELRNHGSRSSGVCREGNDDHAKEVAQLCSRISVENIVAVEQLGGMDSQEMSFEILMLQGADLIANSPEEETAVLHQGEDDLEVLRVITDPSPWKRREATKFFDELRILAYFVRTQCGIDGSVDTDEEEFEFSEHIEGGF